MIPPDEVKAPLMVVAGVIVTAVALAPPIVSVPALLRSRLAACSAPAIPVPETLKLPVSAVPGVDACSVTPLVVQAAKPSTPDPFVSFRQLPLAPKAVGNVS